MPYFRAFTFRLPYAAHELTFTGAAHISIFIEHFFQPPFHIIYISYRHFSQHNIITLSERIFAAISLSYIF